LFPGNSIKTISLNVISMAYSTGTDIFLTSSFWTYHAVIETSVPKEKEWTGIEVASYDYSLVKAA